MARLTDDRIDLMAIHQSENNFMLAGSWEEFDIHDDDDEGIIAIFENGNWAPMTEFDSEQIVVEVPGLADVITLDHWFEMMER